MLQACKPQDNIGEGLLLQRAEVCFMLADIKPARLGRCNKKGGTRPLKVRGIRAQLFDYGKRTSHAINHINYEAYRRSENNKLSEPVGLYINGASVNRFFTSLWTKRNTKSRKKCLQYIHGQPRQERNS